MMGGLLLVLAATSGAVEVRVVTPEGVLRPGVPADVWVAVVDDEGQPVDDPVVTVPKGNMRFGPPLPWAGVQSYRVVPPLDGDKMIFHVRAGGNLYVDDLPVRPAPESRLRLPRMYGVAGSDKVVIRLSGENLPPPEALQVQVAEGSVTSIEQQDNALEVSLRLGDSPYPRAVPVGMRDARTEEAPVWGLVRLHARVPIPLQTEPGAEALFTVGSREYGPFTADEKGGLRATVHQYPGEMQATVVLTDLSGNEIRSTWPLSAHGEPALVLFPDRDQVPGGPPPSVYVYAVHGDGHPWSGRQPTCRTPALGELPLIETGKGRWTMPIPTRTRTLQDLRVECSLGPSVKETLRIPVAANMASRLSLRVWPRELSTDFPVAEVQVLLEDATGERMNVDGVQVVAEHGEVTMEPGNALISRGEYRGDAAVDVGGDALHARYHAPPGAGAVGAVIVAWDQVPIQGPMRMHARAVDRSGRPLAGVELSLSGGAGASRAVTNADGWASTSVPLPAGLGPVHTVVRSAFHEAHGLAIRGTQGVGGPGTPDLVDDAEVRIAPGRSDRVLIELEPATLYVARSSVAFVRVKVLDEAGGLVTDEPVEVEVSEGTLGKPVLQGDGSWLAEYRPEPGGTARTVSVVAKAGSGSTGNAPLRLDPKPVDLAFGMTLGLISNLGVINSPMGGVHVDIRTPWAGGTAMFRLGAGTYFDDANLPVDADGDPATPALSADSRLALIPIHSGVLLRREGQARAVWVGPVGALTVYRQEVRFGNTPVAPGGGVLPGFGVVGGAGVRAGAGIELAVEGRWMQTAAPNGSFPYRGSVGGLAVLGGVRVVY